MTSEPSKVVGSSQSPQQNGLETYAMEESRVDTDSAGTRRPAPLAVTGDELPALEPQPIGSLVGQSFGDYKLLAEIGRGGMGIVYKAHQKSADRLVALKMLLADPNRKPLLLARFLSEIRLVGSLSHRNIVSVYNVGECRFGHYFAMEFIDGHCLETILQERTVPIPWAVSLLIVLAEAVHYAHTRGVIHRDLKPANIMIDRTPRPIVMDFGTAKFLGQSSNLTVEGAIIGTPAYMPPEQAGENTIQVGPCSDVYSLGAILYALLSGRPPFNESTALRTVLKVLSPEMPPPLRELREDIPARLEQICMKCLSKSPGDRFPSARDLALELRQFRTNSSQKRSSFSLRTLLPSVTLVAQGVGKEIRLFHPVTVIGRAADCGIILRVPDVSKHHCQILLKSNQVMVEDLGSVNGTCVNGEPVKSAELRDGDHLDVAGHIFDVHVRTSSSRPAK
jgi:serine/threonine protein kinase